MDTIIVGMELRKAHGIYYDMYFKICIRYLMERDIYCAEICEKPTKWLYGKFH